MFRYLVAWACVFIFASTAASDEWRVSAFDADRDRAYACALHVHSEISSLGRYGLPRLTEVAGVHGLDAVFLTENLTCRAQYGLFPLRNVAWASRDLPSILLFGADAYLEAVARENARQSNVLYVAGAEICPRYYWEGALTRGTLTCYDHQRNLIALGVDSAATLRAIPEARGAMPGVDGGWIVFSRVLAGLGLLVCAGLVFLPRVLARHSLFTTREIRLSMVAGLLLPVILVAAAFEFAAARRPTFQIYGADPSGGHEQRTIDFLRDRGVVNYWAHPEAVDEQWLSACGVPVRIRTRPYPEMLSRTRGFTGFGGVYEDRTTLTAPGGAWDALLGAYSRGDRTEPAWCYGEMLYHYEGQAGKRLGNVQTVVWAESRTREALLDALRRGRCYARRNVGAQRLSLERWEVSCDTGGLRRAFARVSSVVPGESARWTLVRNGAAVAEGVSKTPFELEARCGAGPAGARDYCRLLVQGTNGLQLVSNPLFDAVLPVAGDGAAPGRIP